MRGQEGTATLIKNSIATQQIKLPNHFDSTQLENKTVTIIWFRNRSTGNLNITQFKKLLDEMEQES